MARRLISLICLLSLAVSCTPATQQQVAVATSTLFTATATLTLLETSAATPSATSLMIHAPTATLTVIDTPTVTPTSTYMPTASPSPTSTPMRPTETPRPTPTETLRPSQVVFSDDFSHGLSITRGRPEGWNNVQDQGGKVEIVDDPTHAMDPSTGKPRGKVLKCSVAGLSKFEGPEWMRRAYPGWTNTGGYFGSQTVTGPDAIEVDVWASHQLIASGSKPSASLLSFHANRKGRSPNGHDDPVYSAGLSIAGGGRYLGIMDSTGRWITLSAVSFSPETWYTLRLQVEADGKVLPFINGKLALPNGAEPHRIPKDVEIGFGDGHAGLYSSSGANQSPDFPEGAFILNDNFRIVKYH